MPWQKDNYLQKITSPIGQTTTETLEQTLDSRKSTGAAGLQNIR